MADKALTVAIAGALAAPMAAQAVDFTISGHVNRALFLWDKDNGDKPASVADNGQSGTRIRANGSSVLMDGNKVAIQFEYAAASSFTLRHANVQYSGGFGKVTIGQGSEAGDSSQYSDKSGVWGIGHGVGNPSGFGDNVGLFFGSLDGGGREEMIRYDTPSLGPASLAVSVANGDSVSGRLSMNGDFGGTSVGAQLATLQKPGDTSTIGGSAGVALASGITFSGAWAKGKEMSANLADVDTNAYSWVDLIPRAVVQPADKDLALATDPSYFQATLGYKFGNSAVGVSWYQSKDFVVDGAKGRALGIGASHALPKAGAELYIAMQNYDVSGDFNVRPSVTAELDLDETVYVVGTRVKF